MFGFLCCNKPSGVTSRDIVNVVQNRVRPAKAGHAGTLDPLAEGVLVVGVGRAVRLVPYVQNQAKHYQATFRLGQSTVSGDLEDEVVFHEDDPEPTLEQLQNAATRFVGEIEQTPPAHSAVKVDGRRAYKRVRAGQQVEMPKRTVVVHSMSVTRYEYPEVDLDIVCGSGTYVRTLGMDLAEAVGTKSVMSYLKRTAIGPFKIEDAVEFEQLKANQFSDKILPAQFAVADLPQVSVDAQQEELLGNGRPIECPNISGEEAGITGEEAGAINASGRLVAILRFKRGAWWPYRVFPQD